MISLLIDSRDSSRTSSLSERQTVKQKTSIYKNYCQLICHGKSLCIPLWQCSYLFHDREKISNPKSNPQHLEISPVVVHQFTRLSLQRLMALLGKGVHLPFLASGSCLFGFHNDLYQLICPVHVTTSNTLVICIFSNVCRIICKYQLALVSISLDQNMPGGLSSH